MIEIPQPMETIYNVYIRTDAQNRIFAIGSSAFITDPLENGWIYVTSGTTYEHHHPECGFLSGPLTTIDGIYRYKWDGENIIERTPEEIAADIAAIPSAPLSEIDRLKIRLQAAEDAVVFIMDMNMGGML